MFFGLLGPFEARTDDGAPIAVGGARSRLLLAALALDAGRMVGVDRLLAAVYGEPGSQNDPLNALQAQVSRLRRRLGDPASIEAGAAGYRLAVRPDEVDAHRFTALARRGREALTANRAAEAADLLGEALALWRGDALADLRDAAFTEAPAARLTELRTDAALDAAEARLLRGDDPAGEIAELTALAGEHPLRERPRVLLIRALHAAGRNADALAVFADARENLADELGADPSPELAEAHLAVLRAEPATASTGVPAPFSSFVGREAELRHLAELLANSRLVTVTGFGGAGKTRLAIEAARAHDACFVDLSAATVDTEVAPAVLGALGLREDRLFGGAGTEPVDRLLAALCEKRTLLVLDNCEQVLSGVAGLLRALLAGCPGLRVLATSREALTIPGEALCPLAPLPLSAAELLFAERAAAVLPGFTVDAVSAPVIARICAALDGLPLAVELAAARLRSLPLDRLAARLDDRFRLLAGGNRDAADRHRTLRAVVEWSWDLLDAGEQRVFRRFAVFSGGADVDAVSVVCGLSEVDAEDLLTGLVDKSLIEHSGGRYRMLETIRAFSADRLADAGEHADTAKAHAAHFLALARIADERLRGADQLGWLARLTEEHANLNAALRWCASADPHTGLALLGALTGYWRLRGVRGEVVPLAAALLERVGPEPPEGLTEEYLLCLLGSVSELDGAARARAEELLTRLDWPLRQPYLMVIWALISGPPDADAPPPPFSAGFLASDDPWCRALSHFSASYLRLTTGALAEAEAEFDLALADFREIGDRWGIAQVLDGQAALADLRGDPDRAIAITDEAIELVARLHAREELAELQCKRAGRLLRRGDVAAAREANSTALELARDTGVPAVLCAAQRGFAELARHDGDPAEARRRCALALDAAGPDWQSNSARIQVLGTLGRVAEAEGAAEEARALHTEALELAYAQRFPLDVADAAVGLAGALVDTDPERSAHLLGLASRLRGSAGGPDLVSVAARCVDVLGEPAYSATFETGRAERSPK